MEGIALGCLTALIVSRTRFSPRALRILGAAGAAIMALSLVFSWQAHRSWLGRAGLHMTVLGIGTCMFIAATAQMQWKAPRLLKPILTMGQYSYEIYLTHVFVVFALLGLFLDAGKPMLLVPAYFIGTILISGALGVLVAKTYSEPMNRFLRAYWSKSRQQMGTAMQPEAALPTES